MPLGLPGLLDNREILAFLELREKMVTQDSRVHQDRLDNPESLVYLALREVMVGLELLDLKVPRVRRVTQVKLDPQDHLEMTESTAPEDHQDPKGKRVSLESKEDQDQGDHLV